MKKLLLITSLLSVILFAGAQSERENNLSEAKRIVESGSYRFVVDRAVSASGKIPARNIYGEGYGVEITKEQIKSQLPFFGESSSPQIGQSGSPLRFTSEEYTAGEISVKKRRKFYELEFKIEMTPQQRGAQTQFHFKIADDLTGSLTVYRRDLSRMTYYGTIEEIAEQ